MKTITDTGKLLLTIQSFDNRSITDEVTKLWHQMLGPYSLEDCHSAVMDHYATSEKWLMPIDVIRRVKSIRARRLALVGDVRLRPEDEFNDEGGEYIEAETRRRQLEEAIKAGHLSSNDMADYLTDVIDWNELGRRAHEGARKQQEITA